MSDSTEQSEFDRSTLVELREGLRLLVQGYRYAMELREEPWGYSVEARTLGKTGMTPNDYRWLISRDFVEHRRECTQPNGTAREFEPETPATFNKRSCFILTASGLRVAMQVLSSSASTNGSTAVAAAPSLNGHSNGRSNGRPYWDPDRHEFSLSGKIVKQFKLPSPNQEAILAAFEEEGWPSRIDDPLSPVQEVDPKRRLHDTIKSLNRNQKHTLIRFQGDGTGEGVLWSFTTESGYHA